MKFVLFWVVSTFAMVATNGPTGPPSTASMDNKVDVEEILDDMDIYTEMDDIIKADYGAKKDHRYRDNVLEAITENLVPELCGLTSDNCTVYNSFLLDCNCIEKFEKMSPQCRTLPCDLITHVLDFGPKFVFELFESEDYASVVKVFSREIQAVFDSYDLCTCGSEFVNAFLGCAEFYNGNVLHSLVDSCDIPNIQLVLRSLDLKSLKKFLDGMIDGMCQETGQGRCYNDIFAVIEEVGKMADNTIENYDEYYSGDPDDRHRVDAVTQNFQKEQDKRCDNFLGATTKWFDWRDNNDDDLDDLYYDGPSEDLIEAALDAGSEVMNALYCDKKCRNVVGRKLYPCCLKRLLNDKKMFDSLENVILSVRNTIPVFDIWWDGFENKLYEYRIENRHYFDYEIPRELRKAFMETIHPAKYCDDKGGKSPKCSN